MSELDEICKDVLNVSLSLMLRRTALRKLKRVKKSLKLSHSVVKLIQDVGDESLQRECLSMAGDLCVEQAVDVIMPIGAGSGINARYAVNTLGRLGGKKAYKYLREMNETPGNDLVKYDCRRALGEIKRREPNIEEELLQEAKEIGATVSDLFEESADAVNAANEASKKPVVSDKVELESDAVEIVSDSSFELDDELALIVPKPPKKKKKSKKTEKSVVDHAGEAQARAMVEALRDNELLKEKLDAMENQCALALTASSELDHTLAESEQSFRDAKGEWKKERKNLQGKIDQKGKETPEVDELQLVALKKRLAGQKIIIDKLEGALRREQETINSLREKRDEKKDSKVGCIIGAIIVFFMFVKCIR